jgi:hypothetical protein
MQTIVNQANLYAQQQITAVTKTKHETLMYRTVAAYNNYRNEEISQVNDIHWNHKPKTEWY